MTQDPVTVWTVRTDQPEQVVERLAGLLDEAETRRGAGMPDPVPRARFVVAHGALREIVGTRLGVPAAELRWRRGPNGKPHLEADAPGAAGLRVNLSTCGAIALVALAVDREVGVDVERLPTDRIAARLAARYFPRPEAGYVRAAREPGGQAARFTTLWSRKEACVKARGARLAEGMPLRVRAATPLTVASPAGSADGTVRVHDLPAPYRHRAAVALDGCAPFDVRIRGWAPSAPPAAGPRITEAESHV